MCIVDDGLDYESEDLKDNFVRAALFHAGVIILHSSPGSYDFNDHVALPKPMLPEDIHGHGAPGNRRGSQRRVRRQGCLRCACVRDPDPERGSDEADEALSLYYGSKYNQIYSCSWGPPDNGRAWTRRRALLWKRAFRRGIHLGREGKGTLYVFTSGNGGGYDDNCNYDGTI